MKENHPHYLYIITSINETFPVKLGISNDPQTRLKNLQTGAKDVLVIRHIEPVEAHKVKMLEKMLHKDINHLRLRREWFNLSVEDAKKHIIFTIIHYEDKINEKGKLKSYLET